MPWYWPKHHILVCLWFKGQRNSRVQIAATGKFQSQLITKTPVTPRKIVGLRCRFHFWIQDI